MNTAQVKELYDKVREELKKIIIGQEQIIEHLLISLFAGGHVLIEGVPGLAKTLLAKGVSRSVSGNFGRIQFTPDLMPSDIIGTTIYDGTSGSFSVKKGPVFCNILLADEINRSPAKTQSALLQAMQEKCVTIDGTDYEVDSFFMCIATQNPIEMEGTYPLPEAQVDRFLMKLSIDYPSLTEEQEMLMRYRDGFDAEQIEAAGIAPAVSRDEILSLQSAMKNVVVDDKIITYISEIVAKTRDYPGLIFGASPRGCVALLKTARVRAAFHGRDYVVPDDIKHLAYPVLCHRIILDAEAEIEGLTPQDYIDRILKEVQVPR